ncbi:MAG: tetratricopeptide repeat protein, partial [Planctomycetota bacterium]
LLLTAQVEAQTEVHEAAANTELARLSDTREKLYASLSAKFEGLPGVPPEIAKSILSGALDDQIQVMGIGLIEEPDRAGFVRRHRLRNLRGSVLNKVRARLRDETDFKRIDAIDSLYSKIWNDRYQHYEMEGISALGDGDLESATASATATKMGELLEAEIKFAKSLLPIGALAGGISKTSPVMVQDRPRITKADIRRELNRARECDSGFTADPVVMIAPFEGRGIFEWDRDSLVIPINPVQGSDDAIANATGNYRMLIDSFQQEGHLKKAYEDTFTESNFQAAFQTDYRSWVCAIGKGEREAMEGDRFHFFRTHIGPDTSGVLGPANLLHLSPEARGALMRQLEKQIKSNPNDANLLFRLGVIYWQEGMNQDAIRQLAKTLTVEPDNGIATFSLGLILRSVKATAQAEQAFRACIKRVPESIWAVYAKLALAGDAQ